MLERRDVSSMSPEHADLRKAVAEGVLDALHAVSRDEETVKAFWAAGFRHLSTHAADGTSKWIGKRILTALAVALLGVILGFLIKTGALK